MKKDNNFEDYRTTCCQAPAKRLGRAHYVCSVCEEDVTMELIFIMDAVSEAEKPKIKKKK